ncbi:HlyD family efflux transporter periplasmic adaptor subunit [Marinobacterium lutimaris]|uniref:RND family efflux transporter, MFP subunit n=1 Tax=Marinobacterium lutimaris TaxID=568106 RepID=A0A1H6AIZ6_9GAMM|nr:HlyD family efflux transporter periplasmic adaptor subunit [Marinobacterium lutimaris]SEG48220.1 RND family efflux transporter, MFP subunit [Marinobacterium lutimaris]
MQTPADQPQDESLQSGRSGYGILDQALWSRFRDAADAQSFLTVWLALQCRQLGANAAGTLLMGEPDIGPFTPVAIWPDTGNEDPVMIEAAQQSVQQRRGVVLGEEGKERILAHPLTVQGRLYGVIAVRVTDASLQTTDLFRRLQWGAGWMEVLTLREQAELDAELRERSATAFDTLATLLEHARFDEACNALVGDLASRLNCDTVSVGFVRYRRCRVKALSLSAGFGQRMSLIRDIGTAMDEAIDQNAAILYPPPPEWEYRVTRAHAELAESRKAGAILTLPLQSKGELIGALTFERTRGESFSPDEVEVCDAVAAVVGPILDDRRANDRALAVKIFISLTTQLKRLLGPGYFGRKLATLVVIALIAFFSFAKDDYSVSAPALLQGTVQRTLVAPFGGYLAAQYARAGDLVENGQVLAALDDRDLTLERLRLITAERQSQAEYDRALAEGNRAEANIIRAQIDQAQAQLSLIDEQLSRTRILAPFDGIVVSGDLSQSVGISLERGQELFQIAPLDSYRVVLEVDERDIQNIQPQQQGILRVSAMPETELPYQVERITPMAMQQEGRNFFRVEAQLSTENSDLRPGMEGVARTDIDRRLLIRIWGEKTLNWIQLALWRWLP